LLLTLCGRSEAQSQPVDLQTSTVASRAAATDKVIIDTDIGMDIDDAFALALALDSPELEILGFTTASGDTLARARIIDRMLVESGHADIPVAVGSPTSPPDQSWPDGIIGLQRRYGETARFAKAAHPQAVEFILGMIRQYPGKVTVIAIGPLSNVGALIDRDMDTFRKIKRVVMMGGQVGPVADAAGTPHGPAPEYNIMLDIHSAQKLFRSGVPIYVMPLDSTNNLALDEVKRQRVFSTASALTDSLGLLYLLWNNGTPILYDAMAVTFTAKPELCPVQPMHLTVDDAGVTRVAPGAPNAQVCLHSDSNRFFTYFLDRVTATRRSGEPQGPIISDAHSGNSEASHSELP
jgi:inosine-uridine nucleoside N-ribohydrolase